MEIVGGLGWDFGKAERRDGDRLDMDDTVLDLKLPGDAQGGLEVDDETVFFELRWSHDAVGDAGFVFKGDEDKTLGGAGPLAADHAARDGDLNTVFRERQIAGPPDIR